MKVGILLNSDLTVSRWQYNCILKLKNKKIYVQAGAGIVADSNPKNEYNETINKAKALIKAAIN